MDTPCSFPAPGSAAAPDNCFLFSENCVGCVYVCVHEETEGICWEGGRKEESCVHVGRGEELDCTSLLFRAVQRFLELLSI